jgi:hypothetical protein
MKANEPPATNVTLPQSSRAILKRTEGSLRKSKPDEYGLIRPSAEGCFDAIVGTSSIDRAMKIMADFIELGALKGMAFGSKERESPHMNHHMANKAYRFDRATVIHFDGNTVFMRLAESIDDYPLVLTPQRQKENEARRFFKSHPTHEKRPTGFLTISADTFNTASRRRWSEIRGTPLERRMAQVVDGVCRESVRLREVEKRRDEVNRRTEDEQRREAMKRKVLELAERERREDERRFREVQRDAKAWRASQLVKEYLNSFEVSEIARSGQIDPAGETARWLSWARAKLEAMNPIK